MAVLAALAVIMIFGYQRGWQDVEKENPLIKQSWNVFQEYLAAAKAHDKDKLREHSYKLSSACEDPLQEQECLSRMDTIYFFGSALSERYFRIIQFDDRQIVLTGDYQFVDMDQSRGYLRTVLLFTRDKAGTPKLVGFKNADGPDLEKSGQGIDVLEIDKKLRELTVDSDKDGMTDAAEQCVTRDPNLPSCLETNPNNRDTDGDGWWDSLEYFVER